MEQFSFVFTIFFMLLGPVKIIPAFAALTRDATPEFKREVALRGTLIATGACAFVVLAGEALLGKYHISMDALRIAGGMVLLIAALKTIFPRAQATSSSSGTPTALQLAVAPVAIPIIVPPAGTAALLIFTMLAPQYPGMMMAIVICLAIVMVLDFLVMYFNDRVVKTPGLMLGIQVLGSILVFMQVALAIETMLVALRNMGISKV